jgi:phage terminase small subunit
MSLTAKQEAFVQSLAKGAHQSEAYRQAFGQGGKTNKSLHEAASRLARTGKVVARLAELRAPALIAAEHTILVDLKRVLFEAARVGFSDMRKLFNPGGSLKDPSEWDDDTAAAVASVERVALFGKGADGLGQIGYTTKVKLWPKMLAVDTLMKNLGGYKRDNDQKKDILADLPFEKLKALERFLAARVEQRALALGPPARGRDQPARARPKQDRA